MNSEQITSCDDSDEGWGGGDPQAVKWIPQTDDLERIRLEWALSPTEPDSIRAIRAPNLFTAEDVAAAVKAEREANLDILRTLISSAMAQEEMSYTERYREGCKMQHYAFDLAVTAIAARGDSS